MCVKLSEPKNHIVSVFSALSTLIGKNIIPYHMDLQVCMPTVSSPEYDTIQFKSISCSIQLYNLQSSILR